ncbi:hypothetical protein [Gaetbulibacter aestuarii]|uniref:DUF4258 domain-containing protein n=1 Tax=Gaetbulibacter aestuarii TaxID=1502358 RepID=A0ABW7N0T1_9FLAO
MKFIQRLGYYLTGFAIGLVMLIFFLNGKRASCSYLPNARVTKNISEKKITFDENAKRKVSVLKFDTTQINKMMLHGDVDFGASDQRHKPCGIYNITCELQDKTIEFTVKNCDSLATVTNMKYAEEN